MNIYMVFCEEAHFNGRVGQAVLPPSPSMSPPIIINGKSDQFGAQLGINLCYREYESTVRIVAKAFLKLGLERHHSVCIIGFNSPEWCIADFATIYAG